MGRVQRTSLSDWWARPDGTPPDTPAGDSDAECNMERSPDEAMCTPMSKQEHDDVQATPIARRCAAYSPTKRSSPTFYIGDDESDIQSREGSPRKKVLLNLDAPSVDPAVKSLLKGLCAEYFENNVSPVLRFVQQTQEIWITRLKELTGLVDKKADAVATSAQLEKLNAAMKRKADAADVPDLARPQELQMRVQAAEERVAALTEELQELKKVDSVGRAAETPELSDIKSVKAVFAAAGLRVDKQLKEIRQQMQQLRDQCLGNEFRERWPGRKLPNLTEAPSLDSDNESDRFSGGASTTGSLAASAALDPEEKAELKKIRVILSAAGNAYSRDLREVKSQMREMRSEIQEVRGFMNRHQASSKSSPAELA